MPVSAKVRAGHQKRNQTAAGSWAVWFSIWWSTRLLMSVNRSLIWRRKLYLLYPFRLGASLTVTISCQSVVPLFWWLCCLDYGSPIHRSTFDWVAMLQLTAVYHYVGRQSFRFSVFQLGGAVRPWHLFGHRCHQLLFARTVFPSAAFYSPEYVSFTGINQHFFENIDRNLTD